MQGFEKVPNTAGLKQYRCSAITEILWSHSRLPEISKCLKIGDGFVIALQLIFIMCLILNSDINLVTGGGGDFPRGSFTNLRSVKEK